jgi:peptidyl-prolyl cis-trans isomerase D
MLQIFRDKAQSTIIQAVVLVIALVFVFWGVGANMMDSREAAIVVNDEDISFEQYQRAYDQRLASYRQQFGGDVPEALLKSLGVSEQVKTQLIQQSLLRQGAQAMGVAVSGPEIQRNIQKMVQFQENGVFNVDKYKSILQSNRLTPHKFENSMRYDALSNKGVQAIGDFATTVTAAEIEDLYQQSKESITVSFTEINPAKFIDKVTVEKDALAAWFESNKDKYKTAPQVKLKFLSFSYDSEEMKGKAATEANDAYEGIISAGSLNEYATLHPEAVILQTDFFPRSAPPAIIDNAPSVQTIAFSLKPGELSSLIESPSGFSILFAEAIQEPQIPALSVVEKEVTEDYRKDESRKLALAKGEEILSSLRANGDFSELSKSNDLVLKDATLSRDTAANTSNGFPPSLLMKVFALNESNALPDEVASVDNTLYLYKFVKRSLPDPAEMTDEEKELLTSQIINAKQERLLIAWIRNQEKSADINTNKNLQ